MSEFDEHQHAPLCKVLRQGALTSQSRKALKAFGSNKKYAMAAKGAAIARISRLYRTAFIG
jgi:hypothetical protein